VITRLLAGILLATISYSCASRHPIEPVTSWDPKSGVFRWRGGQVKLPVGAAYQQLGGDTSNGTFTVRGGKLVINYDIGFNAGAFAQRETADLFFEERVVEGARVWIAEKQRRTTTLEAVTFPDSFCANFYAYVADVREAEPVRDIAHSFRPNVKAIYPSTCGRK
jgi:hypothetical protein